MLNWIDHNVWIISAILFILGIRDVLRALKQWKSGSAGYTGDKQVWTESKERVSLWTIGAMVHAYILFGVSIVFFLIYWFER